ncbi:transcriptional regulator [Bacillus sp. J14TS2]|uniref:ArsR/SmtB family transcription factor n=1 Tax=Bacillus sp. J14TS2 TaxID=2807188 RepID=UPI001B145B44|nr:metalloregulator ArsR/SmtB family transcription factor [Bacillus sp. J14TS2]GIN73946.1 transcriptional regulator [Bacillus sp. J14TS2]
MNKEDQLNRIKEDFIDCQKVLLAIGDETRQSILLVLIGTDCQTGLRVGEITEQTHLSRPAVSHHLKILREAGIILMRKEGTKNFYSIDVRTKLGVLKTLVADIEELIFGGIDDESNGN